MRGQIQLLSGGSIIFGLYHSSESEFELVAEELLLSDSTIKVSTLQLTEVMPPSGKTN